MLPSGISLPDFRRFAVRSCRQDESTASFSALPDREKRAYDGMLAVHFESDLSVNAAWLVPLEILEKSGTTRRGNARPLRLRGEWRQDCRVEPVLLAEGPIPTA